MQTLQELQDQSATEGVRAALPYDRYRVRIKTATVKTSSKGQPMIELECEIVGPDRAKNNAIAAGTPFKQWLSFAPKAMGNVATTLTRLHYPPNDPVCCGPEIAQFLTNIEFDMLLSSEEKTSRYQQTPEQKDKGEEGTPILDGEGNPIKLGFEVRTDLRNILPKCFPSKNGVAL